MAKKMKRFRANYGATLPTTAYFEFEAEDIDTARDHAEAFGEKANWCGADCNRPSGCDIEVIDVQEIQ